MRANNRTQAVRLRLCGKLFCFLWGYEAIFIDTRVCSLPCSRFIHSFLKSKARASRNSSVRMLALPRSESGEIQSRF